MEILRDWDGRVVLREAPEGFSINEYALTQYPGSDWFDNLKTIASGERQSVLVLTNEYLFIREHREKAIWAHLLWRKRIISSQLTCNDAPRKRRRWPLGASSKAMRDRFKATMASIDIDKAKNNRGWGHHDYYGHDNQF